MTPEDFLQMQDVLTQLVEAMSPIYQIVSNVRRGFMEAGGVGSEAADLLTVEWCKSTLLPMLAAAQTVEAPAA